MIVYYYYLFIFAIQIGDASGYPQENFYFIQTSIFTPCFWRMFFKICVFPFRTILHH